MLLVDVLEVEVVLEAVVVGWLAHAVVVEAAVEEEVVVDEKKPGIEVDVDEVEVDVELEVDVEEDVVGAATA